MPELPEVETVCRTLRALVIGRTIEKVSVFLPRLIMRPKEPEQFCGLLLGKTIRDIGRRGKFIRFLLDDVVLVSHLRMEGKYGLFSGNDPVAKHTHVIFRFADGDELRYHDVRQFGTMHLFAAGEEWKHPPLNRLGMEPFDQRFTWRYLRDKMGGRLANMKALLLNQSLVAGLGNIYVDEALHRAGIHPLCTPSDLAASDWRNLHQAIVSTLREAVDAGGSSVKSYVNGQGQIGLFQLKLRVYGCKDMPCQTCGQRIVKTVVAGRGTHFCPRCQPLRQQEMNYLGSGPS